MSSGLGLKWSPIGYPGFSTETRNTDLELTTNEYGESDPIVLQLSGVDSQAAIWMTVEQAMALSCALRHAIECVEQAERID